MRYIVQLGAPNTADGTLSRIACGHADKTLELSAAHPEALIVLTGGWGQHFNTAPLAHAEYVYRYLLERGIAPTRFGAMVQSRNSVEDAAMLRNTVETDDHMLIVTSDFHAARAKFIFECLFARTEGVEVISVKTEFQDQAERKRYVEHERATLDALRRQGGVLWNGQLFPQG